MKTIAIGSWIEMQVETVERCEPPNLDDVIETAGSWDTERTRIFWKNFDLFWDFILPRRLASPLA